MIQKIINFIKNRKIHNTNIIILQEKIKPIPLSNDISNKYLFNFTPFYIYYVVTPIL